MNKLVALLLVLLVPLAGFAQDEETVNLDSYIWQLSLQCPCDVGDGWSVTSVISLGDTVSVEVEVPELLGGFIGLLTAKNEKTNRLWVNQVSEFGDDWKALLERLSEEKRWLSLAIKARGDEKTSYLLISPEEIGTILANH